MTLPRPWVSERNPSVRLDTHFTGVDVRGIDALPLLPTGKIDYRSLEALT